MKYLGLCALLSFGILLAEDSNEFRSMPDEITLTTGRTLRKATVVGWKKDSVVLKHAGGIDPIPFLAIKSLTISELESIRAAWLAAQTVAQQPHENKTQAVSAASVRSLPEGQPYTLSTGGIEMIWIMPGNFKMGDDSDGNGPKHTVLITKGFWLGKYEVTQMQWEQVCGNSIRDKLAALIEAIELSKKQPGAIGFYLAKNIVDPRTLKGAGPNYPMYLVTWTEAMEFCQKLTAQERAAGRLPSDWEYTLPTEAQWEYACRAGTTGLYAFPSGTTSDNLYDLNEMAWTEHNSGGMTHPVGQKRPNAWGLFDMHGNVSEWCRDWYGEYAGHIEHDPMGPSSGTLRVMRGGHSWPSALVSRSASRGQAPPSSERGGIGFRLALSPVR